MTGSILEWALDHFDGPRARIWRVWVDTICISDMPEVEIVFFEPGSPKAENERRVDVVHIAWPDEGLGVIRGRLRVQEVSPNIERLQRLRHLEYSKSR